jgi:hypothetical protein
MSFFGLFGSFGFFGFSISQPNERDKPNKPERPVLGPVNKTNEMNQFRQPHESLRPRPANRRALIQPAELLALNAHQPALPKISVPMYPPTLFRERRLLRVRFSLRA